MNELTPRPLRILEVYDDGLDCRHYQLQVQGDSERAASPGQFFMLSVPGVGEAPFTYVTMPDAHGRFHALVRRVGSLTEQLFALPNSAVLGYRGPYGHGWPVAELQECRVLAVAGGCGLAPMSSVLPLLEPGRGALLYGARSEAHQVLSRERAALAEHLPRLEVFDHPQQAQHRRALPLDLLPEAFEAIGGLPELALLCGPEAMMQATAKALLGLGVASDAIHLSMERRMHCGVGLCGHCYIGASLCCKQGPTYRLDRLTALQEVSPQRDPANLRLHHV